MQKVTLHCPNCGSENVGSADTVACTAKGYWTRDSNGNDEFVPEGETIVHWDTQEANDEDCAVCRDCGCAFPPWELDEPPEDDEEEVDLYDPQAVQSVVDDLDQTVERRK